MTSNHEPETLRALFITTNLLGDQEVYTSHIPFEVSERLKALQDAVGGWIEAIDLSHHEVSAGTMYMNEEGKLRGLPVNVLATDAARAMSRISMWDEIVGDVVVLGPTDRKGDDTEIPEDLKNWFYDILQGAL